ICAGSADRPERPASWLSSCWRDAAELSRACWSSLRPGPQLLTSLTALSVEARLEALCARSTARPLAACCSAGGGDGAEVAGLAGVVIMAGAPRRPPAFGRAA